MADRTSAELFGFMFTELASLPGTADLVKKLWRRSREYDFSDYQMNCDDALIALGLARRGTNPQYPDEELTIYANEEGVFE